MTPAVRASFAALLGVLALAGCSEAPQDGPVDADPLLYEIIGTDGAVEGWMLGTIHSLPDGIRWRTPAITQAIDDADYLIVEVAALEDGEAIARTFAQLATTPGQAQLAERIDPALHGELDALIDRSSYSAEDFSATETWAAALMLARVEATGEPANGVDRAIIRDFTGRQVREFEGATMQLGIFDSLPEADQRDLLEGVLREVETLRNRPDRLHSAWLSGDTSVLEEATRTGIMADPELHTALIVERNFRWAEMLQDDLKAAPRPLIAVGTGHLVGPDSLAVLLEKRGYKVERVTQ
ncbi:TraB/GumN family protein [Erythrobacter sp. MTPC3]|uniref:TraB/GumN family protein n=1 Tax=Erythrobacter sp. MTPC3 TaxID=3056564 RepID=UPI0036F1C8B5